MSEEKKTVDSEEVKEEQVALQVKIQSQVKALSEEDKMLFNLYAGESQTVKMSIPELRINYDEDNGIRGGFLTIDYSEKDENGNPKKTITYLEDKEIELTILRTRFKFGFFDESKGEKGMELYGTPEMDDYEGNVNLWDNEQKKVIFEGQYKAFKNYINETYPDPRLVQKGFKGSIIKHTEILYVEYDNKLYRMYLSKTGRDNYWKYKEVIKGVPTFAFTTKLHTTKEKNGQITFFPLFFDKTGDNDIKKYIHLRKKLDKDLEVFDKIRESSKTPDKDTVKGESSTETIIKKYKLDFGEDFVAPICSECGETTVLRDSFKGPFFGCSAYPECKNIVKLEDVMSTEKLPVIEVASEEANSVDTEEKEGEIKVEDIPF